MTTAVFAATFAFPLYAEATEKAASSGNASSQLVSMVTLGLGLLAVLAVILGCAWVVRRMNGLTGMNNQAIKVVSVMALGARERIALIEVGDTQILIGVTASAIRTLHVFDEPVVTPGQGANSDFARRLQGLMAKSWTSGRSPGEPHQHNPDSSSDTASTKRDRSDGISS
ncbi:flagellar biosynthetic protein FliO [Marinobacter salicampi]|uniref:flagellar biosynthetic protein FliO n=1 Tax=Marinobacter salicampi TaxID=435907 RepID=UPI00140E0327|nr:flagellar biosynthetic protein FliO [Marinobacter salicampi]